MIENKGLILDELEQIRDNLYNSLPRGDLDAFELIKAIKIHIKDLDKTVDYYRKVEKDIIKDCS